MATFVVYSIIYFIVAMLIDRAFEGKESKSLSYFRTGLYATTTVVCVGLALCSFFGGGWDTSKTVDTPTNYHNPKGHALLGIINFFISVGPYGLGLICLLFAYGQFASFKNEKLKIQNYKKINQSSKQNISA